ncbi:hypothetical protein QW71_05655 [Paenibacillus sp. IHB B 3415]|uniref:XkdX family protein n=1 Tax=Paenibacillus sp. IHB B 3415 TaxID=867080 RepID=UPI000575A08B|nr:XkdX family protein [Paenibacillus sp. IHB B 3415]KHL96737.1 hypothetical protein QW71_05655 [Paenibacillus sp. IHB B 3415]
MDWYALVKRYYAAGLYSAAQVQVFVTAKKITADQATENYNQRRIVGVFILPSELLRGQFL